MAEPRTKKQRLLCNKSAKAFSYFQLIPTGLLLFFGQRYYLLHHLAHLLPKEVIYEAALTVNSRCDTIQIAALLGNRLFLAYFGKLTDLEKLLVFCRAIEANNLQLAQIFFSDTRHHRLDTFVLGKAIGHNNITMLEWLFSHGVMGRTKLIDLALEYGNVETVKWISDRTEDVIFSQRKDNLQIDVYSFLAAIRSGVTANAIWICEQFKKRNISIKNYPDAIALAAVESRNLKTIELLLCHRKTNFNKNILISETRESSSFINEKPKEEFCYVKVKKSAKKTAMKRLLCYVRGNFYCPGPGGRDIPVSVKYFCPRQDEKCSKIAVFRWLYAKNFISSTTMLLTLCRDGSLEELTAFWNGRELKEAKMLSNGPNDPSGPNLPSGPSGPTNQNDLKRSWREIIDLITANGEKDFHLQTEHIRTEDIATTAPKIELLMIRRIIDCGKIEFAKFFLQQGCPPSAALVWFFAQRGDFATVREIYKTDVRGSNYFMLKYAINENDVEFLTLLLDHGHSWEPKLLEDSFLRLSPEICTYLADRGLLQISEDKAFNFLCSRNIESYKIMRKDDDFSWLTTAEIVKLFMHKNFAALQLIQEKRNIFSVKFLCQMIKEKEYAVASVIHASLEATLNKYGLRPLGKEKLIKLVAEAMFKLDLGLIYWLMQQNYQKEAAELIAEVAVERRKINMLIHGYEKKKWSGIFMTNTLISEISRQMKWEQGLIYHYIGQAKLDWHLHKNFKSKKSTALIQAQNVQVNFMDWVKSRGFVGEEIEIVESLREEWKWLRENGYGQS